MREAWANAIQELAFTLANAIAYIENTLNKGLSIDEFAPTASRIFFCSDIDLFEEVAKFRAARRIWAKLMKTRFGAQNPASLRLILTGFTAGSNLTAQQPLNNIVRVTIGALASILGGEQSLTTSSYDEALALPSEEAVTVALRTQQIIAYESGVVNTVDPLGRSYYVESLTNQIEERAMGYLEKIDKLGGAVRAIERGYFQKELSESAYQYQKEVESGERIIVGVNKFATDSKVKIPTLTVGPQAVEGQIRRLKEVKRERNSRKVSESLLFIQETARKKKNLVPPILTAVRDYATIGEICDALREIHGEYKSQSLD
jgi:methylmalonyl-CoA mutase N-terminal domain/subunit